MARRNNEIMDVYLRRKWFSHTAPDAGATAMYSEMGRINFGVRGAVIQIMGYILTPIL